MNVMARLLICVLFATVGRGPLSVEELTAQVVQESEGEAVLAASAHLYVVNVSLTYAINRLRDQSGTQIAFSPSLFPDHVRVTCRCLDATVGEALDQLLSDRRFTYTVVRRQIAIHVREAHTDDRQPSPSLHRPRVDGQVLSQRTNAPIRGAEVSVKGTAIQVLTDGEGRFAIPVPPPGPSAIHVTFLGYSPATRSLEFNGETGETLEIRLAERPLEFDAIVVTGTAGQARRREVGNSIGLIRATESLEAAMTLDHLLQGRVVGMNTVPTTGAVGAGSQIRLRGNVSPSLSNHPLVYVDGVPQSRDSYPSSFIQGGPSHLGGAPPSPLNDINPRDIERIEVVRGAAATTLYGSEAASGVIQIFTRRGQSGSPSFTYQMRNIVRRVGSFGSDARPFLNMEPFLQTGYSQAHDLSVSGGSENSRFFGSALYEDGTGVHAESGETRVSLRGNVNLDLSDRIHLEWNNTFSRHDLESPQTGRTLYGLEFNAFRAPNNLIGSGDPEALKSLLGARVSQMNQRLNTGLTASFASTPRSEHRLTLGMDRMGADIEQLAPFGYVLAPDGFIGTKQWLSESRTFDYKGTYSARTEEPIQMTFSWGVQVIERRERVQELFGFGLPGPSQNEVAFASEIFGSAETLRTITGGLFAQSLFNLADRYFLTIGIRGDGSSVFGSNLGLQPYPKVGASWVVSDEPFWNPGWGQLRLRGAFGYAGRAPNAFDATKTWEHHSHRNRPAFLPRSVGNPDLGPERTQELDVGFEGSFLADRIGLSFTYYLQLTTDALFPVQQTPSGGFSETQLENIGKLSNRGVEAELSLGLVERPNFTWLTQATVATNRSRVLHLGGEEYFDFAEGHPVPVVRGTKVVNPDELADPIYDWNAFHGPNHPTRTIGLSTSLSFFQLASLSARVEYQGGHFIRDGASSGMASRGAGAPACDANAYRIVPFDAFPNHPNVDQLTALERARCYGQRGGADFRVWIYPADFLKLRDINLRVPVDFLAGAGRTASLNASIGNILLWTHADFPAFDPESAVDMNDIDRHINTVTPTPAHLTVSLQVNF